MYQLNHTSKRAKGPTKLLIPSSVLNQNLNLNKFKNAINKGINVGHPEGARQKTKGCESQPTLVLGPEGQPLNSMESDGVTINSVEISILEGEQHHRQVWEEHEQDHLSEEDGVPSQDGEHHRQRLRQEEHEQVHLSEEDRVHSQDGEHHRQRHRQEVHDEGQSCQPPEWPTPKTKSKPERK